MTVWVNRPQAYELELLCCYQNILKQNSTEEKRVNKNVLKHIISSSEFSEQWNIFLIFRIQCQCKDHIQGSRDAPFQEVGTVPRSGNWRCTAGESHTSAAGGLSVGGFPVAAILLRYAGAAVHVPGPLCPVPPSSRDVNEVGCVQQMLEAGASSLAPPRPAPQ